MSKKAPASDNVRQRTDHNPIKKSPPKPNGALVWGAGLIAGGYAAVAAWVNGTWEAVKDWLIFWN